MHPTDMATIHSDKFNSDAVRITQISKDQKWVRGIVFPEDGMTRRQVASDLGSGHSTLRAWIGVFSEEPTFPAQDAELPSEKKRLRNGNQTLRVRAWQENSPAGCSFGERGKLPREPATHVSAKNP